MKFPHLNQPEKGRNKETCWAGSKPKDYTPKGKIQNTTYIYGRNDGQKGRRTTKPE